jgi:hypothetical protein
VSSVLLTTMVTNSLSEAATRISTDCSNMTAPAQARGLTVSCRTWRQEG